MKKITSICLTIFLGVNIVSAYAARGEQLAILSEDFSAFTEGTESTPAESELSTGNAMIPMEFTHGITVERTRYSSSRRSLRCTLL